MVVVDCCLVWVVDLLVVWCVWLEGGRREKKFCDVFRFPEWVFVLHFTVAGT